VRASVETALARGDGSDIRVFRADGTPIPHIVQNIQPNANSLTYTLGFIDTLAGNETRAYEVRYGDPTAGWLYLTQNAITPGLLLNTRQIGGMWVYSDPAQAYAPADFETAGAKFSDNNDGTVYTRPLPNGGTALWDGVSHNSSYHEPNSSLRLGASTSTVGFMFSNQDWYDYYRREVIYPDGFAWHLDVVSWVNKTTQHSRVGIRYYQGGRWVLTVSEAVNMNWGVSAWPGNIRLATPNGNLDLPVPANINRNDPSTWVTYVIEQPGVVAAVGAETSV